MGPNLDRPMLELPKADGSATDKYEELRKVRLEIANIYQMYNTNNVDRVPIIITG